MANLVRQVGRKAAFELVALGEPIDAERALELGMVNRVVAGEELMAEALAYRGKAGSRGRAAMAETKRLFHEVADLPLAAGARARAGHQQAHAQFPKLTKEASSEAARRR